MMCSIDLNPQPRSPKQLRSASNRSVMLLHGGAVSHRMYNAVVPLLVDHLHHVYVPDLPGHGSSVAMGPFSFTKSTTLLLAAIKKLKLETEGRLCLVGVSLGGQAVLDILQHDTEKLIDCAIVASASIQPPDDSARFEMPRMPPEQEWMDIIMGDVARIAPEDLPEIQNQSFKFTFSPGPTLPPVLIVLGEHDIAMAKRDFDLLCNIVKKENDRSEGIVLANAWHNHPIDIPERFAQVILDWIGKIL